MPNRGHQAAFGHKRPFVNPLEIGTKLTMFSPFAIRYRFNSSYRLPPVDALI